MYFQSPATYSARECAVNQAATASSGGPAAAATAPSCPTAPSLVSNKHVRDTICSNISSRGSTYVRLSLGCHPPMKHPEFSLLQADTSAHPALEQTASQALGTAMTAARHKASSLSLQAQVSTAVLSGHPLTAICAAPAPNPQPAHLSGCLRLAP